MTTPPPPPPMHTFNAAFVINFSFSVQALDNPTALDQMNTYIKSLQLPPNASITVTYTRTS